MSILDKIMRRKRSSASLAKERLQIIISHERVHRNSPDYLPLLQQELIDVISKYVKIDPDSVKVALERTEDAAVLELNISLPEEEVLA